MSVRVSVVIATYNTGEEIEKTAASVRRQSLGLNAVELILVDDGSTDGDTRARLQTLAREPWVTVREIPNSGWPCRPRNVGLDLAKGDYVFFMDHDDRLYPEALERMVIAGDRAGADMVVGKEVRTGARTMGLETFRANHDRAHVTDDHVANMLTPHKMFRRQFLLEHDVRFGEHLKRLEDHHLLAAVFVHDPVVSVVADYPCYRWIIHDTNSSIRHPDPSQYFAAAGEVLDLVDAWPYGARVQEVAYRMWERSTVLDRFGPGGLRTWPEDYRRRFFEVAAAHLRERFDPALDAGLPAMHRVRAALARAGDLDGIVAYSTAEQAVSTRPSINEARVRDRSLHLTTSVRLEGADGPVLFDHADDGRVLQRPAGPLPAHIAESALDVTDDASIATVEVLLTHRSTNADWLVPTQLTASFSPGGDGVSWQARAEAVIDPATALLGGPITPGVWDVKLRTTAFGYDSRVALRVPPEQVLPTLAGAASHVVPYRTRNGRLALRVGKPAPLAQRRTLRARIGLRTRMRKLLGP